MRLPRVSPPKTLVLKKGLDGSRLRKKVAAYEELFGVRPHVWVVGRLSWYDPTSWKWISIRLADDEKARVYDRSRSGKYMSCVVGAGDQATVVTFDGASPSCTLFLSSPAPSDPTDEEILELVSHLMNDVEVTIDEYKALQGRDDRTDPSVDELTAVLVGGQIPRPNFEKQDSDLDFEYS